MLKFFYNKNKEVKNKLNSILDSDKIKQEKKEVLRINFQQHLETVRLKKIKGGFF